MDLSKAEIVCWIYSLSISSLKEHHLVHLTLCTAPLSEGTKDIRQSHYLQHTALNMTA